MLPVIHFRDKRGFPGSLRPARLAPPWGLVLDFDTVISMLLIHGKHFPFDIMYAGNAWEMDTSLDLEMADFLNMRELVEALHSYGMFQLYATEWELDKYASKEAKKFIMEASESCTNSTHPR